MNKPIQPPIPDDDIGPLDEHGQQIWSPEEEAAIARMEADPEFQAGLARAEAEADAGLGYTMEESNARFAAMRKCWLEERGLA